MAEFLKKTYDDQNIVGRNVCMKSILKQLLIVQGVLGFVAFLIIWALGTITLANWSLWLFRVGLIIFICGIVIVSPPRMDRGFSRLGSRNHAWGIDQVYQERYGKTRGEIYKEEYGLNDDTIEVMHKDALQVAEQLPTLKKDLFFIAICTCLLGLTFKVLGAVLGSY
jgi:hypothetical protein